MVRVSVPFIAIHPAAKAAVEQLTRASAAEYGHRGIRVVTMAPGGRGRGPGPTVALWRRSCRMPSVEPDAGRSGSRSSAPWPDSRSGSG
ncbi:SDR family oxidoreductase [Curtobacterium sp. L1-20]|uniref:SDR family oxidoreductase n=1 Tax=Curtobacterium sp. L1-20 TaxID=3138181 RepID=UPI003B52EA85